MNVNKLLIASVLLASTLGTSGCLVRVSPGTAVYEVENEPPPPRRVVRPAPRPGYAWVEGYWRYSSNQWLWVDGYWQRERSGHVWVDGRWDRRGNSWIWVEGTWRTGENRTRARKPDRHRQNDQDHQRTKQAPGTVVVPGRTGN